MLKKPHVYLEFPVVEDCVKLEPMDILHGDTDWESSSDSSSSDDYEELDFLYCGQTSNILSSLEESIRKIDDFLSYERGFTHGDIVRSATDPFGQMGRVVSVKMSVDVENFHGKIMRDVESKNLLKLHSINVGDHVVHGPWVGRVDKVVDRIAVLFDDGTKCEVSAMDQEKLRPISPHLLDDSPYLFYPGLRVQVGVSGSSKSARWLCGSLKKNQDTGTVSSVKADLVYVDWLASVHVGSDLIMPVPQRLQHADSLTVLQYFAHENWQLGDWCLLPQTDRNVFNEVFAIIKTKTVVDVEWQDGAHSLGVDTRSIVPVNVANAHEFWPGQFVVEKGACDDSNGSSNQNWGLVIGVDAKERTVKVRWKSISMSQETEVGNDAVVETVSAYELDEHPDYTYCFGDIVLKCLNQVDMDKGVALNSEDCENMDGSKTFLQFIGCVTDFMDGYVKVMWASGLETKVAPDEIFRIDKSDGSANSFQDSLRSNEISERNKNDQAESSSSFFPRFSVGFLTNIAATLFGTFVSAAKSASISSEHFRTSELAKANDISAEIQPLVSNGVQPLDDTNSKQQYDDVSRKGKLIAPDSRSREQFQHFDIVDDCSDHHFFDSGKGFELSQVNRAWLKRVQQEWNVLAKNLPESIYVRVYEERMDLLRAAIVGASGTPYHNGLFFFDIHIPPQYPHEPLLVHYISGGLRVNPNLYESGKVCLSLLNTWTGAGSEVWNPVNSNILQVLLSLQALVLNEKPYFNEAGFDKQIGKVEGEKNSVSYNENAFLLTWKSMLYLLRRPPKHFEALLEEHLKRHSQDILSVCKVYIDGTPAASASGHGKTLQENITGSSTGFKLMLAKLFPKLVQALSARGIDCSHFAITGK